MHCIDIGIGEEWYGIASGIISFRKHSYGPWFMSKKCSFAQCLKMNRRISIKFCICIDIYIWSCYTFRTLSVHPSVRNPSVRLSVSASFPCSNFSTFWPIFFKLCIDIGNVEEWYGIASGLFSFLNNRVMALDVCQKCFALRFLALTLVHFFIDFL